MTLLLSFFRIALHAVIGALLTVSAFFGSHSSVSFESPSPSPVQIASTNVPLSSSTPRLAATPARPVQAASSTRQTPAEMPHITIPSIPTPPEPQISSDALNAEARDAVVNILCTTQTGGSFEPISGSGVIIDPRGVILTNAHVAQFFLLHDYPFPDNIQCVIRTGSPAQARYTASLLYLPPQWVADNASQITSDHETGTGQNDYAFLLITGTADSGASLPSSFPYAPISYANPESGEQMLLASYPAGFLSGINIQTNLYLTSAYATVGDLYVFDAKDQWVDLFSIPGTVVSQSGSSGGAALRAQDGELSGIIVTETLSTTTSGRDLRAVAIEHIEHSLENAGISGIVGLLSGDLQQTALDFERDTAPQERQGLYDALQK